MGTWHDKNIQSGDRSKSTFTFPPECSYGSG